MADEMAQFFILAETQTHAIDKLTKLKQENRLLEDFWSEFVTWKELSGYNKIVLVSLFKKGVIDGLWYLLVITLGGCSGRTRWSSLLDWATTYTIL